MATARPCLSPVLKSRKSWGSARCRWDTFFRLRLGLSADADHGGWLLDKFGSKKVYSYSLFFWSLFTFLQGFIDVFPLTLGRGLHVLYAFYAGLFRSALVSRQRPHCGGLVSGQRAGTASAIFNAAQYFSLALFSPLLGWLTFALGWEHVFTVMGIIGFVLTIIWVKFVHNPTDHPRMSAAELKYISEGGAVVDMDHKKRPPRRPGRRWTISASC